MKPNCTFLQISIDQEYLSPPIWKTLNYGIVLVELGESECRNITIKLVKEKGILFLSYLRKVLLSSMSGGI